MISNLKEETEQENNDFDHKITIKTVQAEVDNLEETHLQIQSL